GSYEGGPGCRGACEQGGLASAGGEGAKETRGTRRWGALLALRPARDGETRRTGTPPGRRRVGGIEEIRQYRPDRGKERPGREARGREHTGLARFTGASGQTTHARMAGTNGRPGQGRRQEAQRRV